MIIDFIAMCLWQFRVTNYLLEIPRIKKNYYFILSIGALGSHEMFLSIICRVKAKARKQQRASKTKKVDHQFPYLISQISNLISKFRVSLGAQKSPGSRLKYIAATWARRGPIFFTLNAFGLIYFCLHPLEMLHLRLTSAGYQLTNSSPIASIGRTHAWSNYVGYEPISAFWQEAWALLNNFTKLGGFLNFFTVPWPLHKILASIFKVVLSTLARIKLF